MENHVRKTKLTFHTQKKTADEAMGVDGEDIYPLRGAWSADSLLVPRPPGSQGHCSAALTARQGDGWARSLDPMAVSAQAHRLCPVQPMHERVRTGVREKK